jgi:small subunit ribosomal protein S4
MAKNTTPKGKIVRRFGINIFGQPKFDRLLKKKKHAPGKSAKSRVNSKISDYGKQLTEKQKFRFCYGISERQFRNIYEKAKKMRGITGNKMIELQESRLDNVVYRLGWASTRAQARQLVCHKHFLLNGISHNIPSTFLKPGDAIAVKDKKGIKELIRQNLASPAVQKAGWIEQDADNLKGIFKSAPGMEEAQPAGNIQMVVEFYSRR